MLPVKTLVRRVQTRIHTGWSSWHNTGQAVDFAMESLNNPERRQWIKERAKYYKLVPLDEYENPSAHSTGPHFHLSDHGEELDGVDIGNNYSRSMSQSDDISDITAQNINEGNNVWRYATAASRYAKEKYNVDIAPWIFKGILDEETGYNHNSQLFRTHNNTGGIKYVGQEGATEGSISPEGNPYARFENLIASMQESARVVSRDAYEGVRTAKNGQEAMEALWNGDYFTSEGNKSEYAQVLERARQEYENSNVAKFLYQNVPRKQNHSTSQVQMENPQENKPLFSMSADNPATEKLVSDFMETWKGADANKQTDLFSGMFDTEGKFINSVENRQKLIDEHGDLLAAYKNFIDNENLSSDKVEGGKGGRIHADEESKIEFVKKHLEELRKGAGQQSSQQRKLEFDNEKDAILDAAQKLIEQKRESGDWSYQKIETAQQSGDIETLKQILKDNGAMVEKPISKVEIQPQQVQSQNPVKRSQYRKIPETVAEVFQKAKIDNERLNKALEVAQQPVAKSETQRKVQGKAQLVIAKELGIKLDESLKKYLWEGTPKSIKAAQEQLRKAGAFELSKEDAQFYSMANREQRDKMAREEADFQRELEQEEKGRQSIYNALTNYAQKRSYEEYANRRRQREETRQKFVDDVKEHFTNAFDSAFREERRQGPLPKAIKGIIGSKAEVRSDKGKTYQSKYKVVDIDDLTISDNERYPQELQPRDRDRKAMKANVAQMEQNIRPLDLMESRNVNEGAPVIRKDGVVLNGNGRAMGIRGAYEIGKAGNYRQALVDNAQRLGLNKDEVAQMQRPILVRTLDDVADEDLADITQSTTGGSRMGASEQARIDADKINNEVLKQYVPNDLGDFTTSANRDFVSGVLGAVSDQNDLNAYTDKNGNINADGINRVKRAVFARAYGDEGLISKMSESTDDNVRNVSNGLMSVAPNMASLQIRMEAGELHNYDIGKPISEAVQKLSTLRDEGTPISAYLNQQSAFEEYQDSNEMKDILAFLDENKRKPKRIAQFLNKIADVIRAQGDPRQVQLIEGGEPMSLSDIISLARQSVEESGSSEYERDTSKQEDIQSTVENDKPKRKAKLEPINKQEEEVLRLVPSGKKVDADYIIAQIDDSISMTQIMKIIRSLEDKEYINADGEQKYIRTPKGNSYLKYGASEPKDSKKTKELTPSELSDAIDDLIAKWSRNGQGELYVKAVDAKDLTDLQRGIAEIGEQLGVPVVYFKGDKRLNGAHADGIAYINVDSPVDPRWIFWHESGHWLKAQYPKLMNEIIDNLNISNKQIKDFRDRTRRYDLSDGEVREEIFADNMFDADKRIDVLQALGKKDAGLVDRLVSWLKSVMDRVTNYFNTPKYGLTNSQKNQMFAELGKALKQIKESNGKPRYRYGDVSHAVQYFDGRGLEDFDESNSEIKYSIGRSNDDNSSRGFIKKVKNFFSSKNDLNERQLKRFTRQLTEISGYKIGFGRTDKDIDVKDKEKVIRTKKAYDWERILPVVGKLTARQLGLQETPEMSNYIADWILTGTVNNRSAEAIAFEKAMRERPDIADRLLEVRQTAQDEIDMTPVERIRAGIRSENSKKSFVQLLEIGKRKFDEEWRDDLNPIKRMVEEIEKTSGQKVPEELSAYVESQMYKGCDDIAYECMILADSKHVDSAVEALQKRFPTVDFTGFKPLAAILEEAGGHKAREDFSSYVTAKMVKDIHLWNKVHPENQMDTRYDEKTCDATIAELQGQFDQAQKDLVGFSKVQLELLYRSGLLTDKNYQEMKNKWSNYVPLHRVFDENEDLNNGDSMKRMKGSGRDIIDPIQSIHKNTFENIRRAEKNLVKCKLANLTRCGGVGKIIEEVDKGQPNVNKTVTFYEGGKRKYLEIEDEAVVRAINNVDNRAQGSWVLKMIRAATGVVRAAMTAASPDFAVGNVFRDLPDAYVNNKYGKKNPFPLLLYTWKGLMSAIHKDKDFYEWMAFGGGQATFVSEDRDRLQSSLNNMSKTRTERWFKSGVKGFLGQVLESMQLMSEYSEYATRIGVYKMTRDALAEKNSDKQASWSNKRKAAYVSRDATIDFARVGRSARALNSYFAFSNAAIQGIDRFCRTFDLKKAKTEQGRKELFSAAFRLAISSVLPTILLFAWNHDDDWYKDLPDWQKDNNWILGKRVKIPKGFDLGLRLTSNLTEQFLKWAWDHDSFELRRVLEPIKDSLPYLSTYLMPTLLAPIAEVGANYSFFREAPVVPSKLKGLPAHMQYDAYTSGFAKTIGDVTGYSPKKIDHLISGYFGFMGRFALQGYDMTVGNKQLDLAVENMPMFRRFLFDPYKNPKSVKDYYETAEKQNALYEEYKTTKKKPKGYDPRLHARVKATKKMMSKLSNAENAIINDARLSVDERKARLHELEQKRMALANRALGR